MNFIQSPEMLLVVPPPFIELTDDHNEKFLVNTDHIIQIARNAGHAHMMIRDYGWTKVQETFDEVKKLMFPEVKHDGE